MTELQLWFRPVEYPVHTLSRGDLYGAVANVISEMPVSKLDKKTTIRLCTILDDVEWLCVNNFEVDGIECLVTQSTDQSFQDWPQWKVNLAERLDEFITQRLEVADEDATYIVHVED